MNNHIFDPQMSYKKQDVTHFYIHTKLDCDAIFRLMDLDIDTKMKKLDVWSALQ